MRNRKVLINIRKFKGKLLKLSQESQEIKTEVKEEAEGSSEGGDDFTEDSNTEK